MQKGIDSIGVTVVYFCHDGKGKFVMAKRSNQARDEQGKWDIGGGAIELHDTVEDTLRKEILEEYCTEVLSFEFLGYRDVHREKNGEKNHWIALDFKVLVDSKTVINNEPQKFDDIGWFTLSSLGKVTGMSDEQLHSQLPEFLRKYKAKL